MKLSQYSFFALVLKKLCSGAEKVEVSLFLGNGENGHDVLYQDDHVYYFKQYHTMYSTILLTIG